MAKEDKKNQAPAEAVKIVTVEELAKAYPELVRQIKDETAEAVKIVTAEELQKAYPELVQQIKDETAKFIEGRSAADIKRVMPGLYGRIAAAVNTGGGPDLSVKGFLLNMADPYAAGTLRTYMAEKETGGLALPYVLPFRDRHTKAAIKNYILRADGGGDTERAEAARKALAKCK